MQPHLHKVHFFEPPSITRKQCVDLQDNVYARFRVQRGQLPLSAGCSVRTGLPSQVGVGPQGEQVLPEVRELESQGGGTGSPGSVSASSSDRVEGETSHGGSADSSSSVADAGSPLGSLVSRVFVRPLRIRSCVVRGFEQTQARSGAVPCGTRWFQIFLSAGIPTRFSRSLFEDTLDWGLETGLVAVLSDLPLGRHAGRSGLN